LVLTALPTAPRRSAHLKFAISIARISREKPLWGSERTRGALRKLGVTVSNRSIRR
jgi:transposase InsO family protein